MKIYIVESVSSNDKLYLHSLEGEQFQNFVAKHKHVSIFSLDEKTDSSECAAIASSCLSIKDGIAVGFLAMIAREPISSHLIKMMEERKEFAN